MDVQLCFLFCSLLVIINLYYCIFYQYLDEINLIIIIIIIINSLERQTLLDLFEHYIPKFARLNRKKELEILLKGINPDDSKFSQLNTIFKHNFLGHNMIQYNADNIGLMNQNNSEHQNMNKQTADNAT